MRVGGIVLCGGESRRMGSPKAWLPFGGERMLQRVVRILGEAVAPLVAVAAPDQALPELPPGVQVVCDPVAGRGPLQGLATGLRALPSGVEAAYVSACDVPLLRAGFVRYLAGRAGEAVVVAPQAGGRLHPLAAVYRTSVLPEAEAMLESGCLRLTELLGRVDLRGVAEDDLRQADPDLRSLLNLNGPEDYREALRLAGLAGDRG